MGDWKLIFDIMGNCQLYNIKIDPCELNHLFNKPEAAAWQCEPMTEFCIWTIRSQDGLPTGPKMRNTTPNGHAATTCTPLPTWDRADSLYPLTRMPDPFRVSA